MPLAFVHENTTAYLTIAFQDATGAPSVPTSASFRLDCLSSGREIANWTPIPTPAATVALTLAPLWNCIFNAARRRELRSLQVVAHYGPGDQIHSEFRFEVVNLREPIEPVLVAGDDYLDADGRALKWTGGGGWPPLLDATILLTLSRADATLSLPGDVEAATGPNKVVRVALPATHTQFLSIGTHRYALVASFANGRSITLATGNLQVTER